MDVLATTLATDGVEVGADMDVLATTLAGLANRTAAQL